MKKTFKLPWAAGALLACSAFAGNAQAQTTINFALTQPAVMQANAGTSRNFCPGETVTLQGSATGGTSPYTYAWSGGVSNPTTAQPTVNPTGTTTYTLAITDATGCTSTATVTLTQVICSGLPENHLASLQLQPNPAKEQVLLKLQTGKATAYQIRLTNLVGQEVSFRQVPATNNLQEVLRLDGLAKGIYLLQLSNPEGTAVRKLIVE